MAQNNAEGSLSYYKSLWESEPEGGSNQEKWDMRAVDWIAQLGEDGSGKPGTNARIENAVRIIKENGLIGPGDSVCDIGCGPGLFSIEFAKLAKRAAGYDLSPRFIEYAREQAKKQGIANVSFEAVGFGSLDIDKSGLRGAFQLVFSSLCPALCESGALEKAVAMASRHFMAIQFIETSDSLTKKISKEAFGEDFIEESGRSEFNALFNILWLMGYYPEIRYFEDSRDEVLEPSMLAAGRFALAAGKDSDEGRKEVLAYLKSLGESFDVHTERLYGAVFLDVGRKSEG